MVTLEIWWLIKIYKKYRVIVKCCLVPKYQIIQHAHIIIKEPFTRKNISKQPLRIQDIIADLSFINSIYNRLAIYELKHYYEMKVNSF